MVIGVGNPLRRDDGAGPAVVQRLSEGPLPPGVQLMQHHGEGLSLLDAWQDHDKVVLVDAAYSGANPGAIHRFDAAKTALPRRLFYYSSHLFGLAEAVELARSLSRLPGTMIVYGIEGTHFGYGAELSAEVAQAADAVAEFVRADCKR